MRKNKKEKSFYMIYNPDSHLPPKKRFATAPMKVSKLR